MKHSYFCVKCNLHDPQLIPSYMWLCSIIQVTPKFLLFDNLANQLLHQPCLELTGLISDEGSENIAAIDNSIVSYAPEGSMMLRGCPSAKRAGAPVINLEETFDQTSVTRTHCPVKIKKEKKDKSG
ncbi:hypothetical protein HID58_007052 [Brassica napus]|uniref:Uncharacterized protein n=1 Tax=Brassica napus TaxID=3708 RepID=A0ABQ8EG25_BRANA|nr:hypothetical protein HID58_007052 [Brassica napus]